MGKKKRRQSWGDKQPPAVVTVKPQIQEIMSTKKLKQVKEFNGMMTCILEHEISKSTAIYEWTGPKIDPEVWRQVLAFFKWSYDTTKSETQVRLYVNHQTREWAAWAFPQKLGLGMAAKEIDEGQEGYDLTREQRAQFSDADGWFYYGTVHHHCSSGAFQSSTDTANEFNQDGLHITVGGLDKEQYSLDCRLYQSGYKLGALNMLQFWDVGDPLAEIPMAIQKLLPEDALKTFALIQMGTPAPADQAFPEVWKTNLIAPPAPVVHVSSGYSPSHSGFHGSGPYYRKCYYIRSIRDLDWDADRALEELLKFLDARTPAMRLTLTEVVSMLEDIDKTIDSDYLDLIDIVTHNDTTFKTFIKKVKAKADWLREYDLKKAKLDKVPLQLGNGRSQTAEELQQELKEVMEAEGGLPYHGYGDGYGIGG